MVFNHVAWLCVLQVIPSTCINADIATQDAGSRGGPSYSQGRSKRDKEINLKPPHLRSNLGREREAEEEGQGVRTLNMKHICSRDASREGSMVGLDSMGMTEVGSVGAHGGDPEEIVSKSKPWRASPSPPGVEGASHTLQAQPGGVSGNDNGLSMVPELHIGEEVEAAFAKHASKVKVWIEEACEGPAGS
jgi:hypothetical protein